MPPAIPLATYRLQLTADFAHVRTLSSNDRWCHAFCEAQQARAGRMRDNIK